MTGRTKNIFNRKDALAKMSSEKVWDVIVIGGGATGLGVAVDAACRGFRALLIEKDDFAKGTSSRSTKLVHGGVRYLAQGKVRLVLEALRERGILFNNAPHLIKKQDFIIPCYNWFQKWQYLAGLKIYDWLSGKWSIGKSEWLDRETVRRLIPEIKMTSLIGGVKYCDGQFDDARMAISLARTCSNLGGVVINYCKVIGLNKSNGKITGVDVIDLETGKKFVLQSKSVVNATGVFADAILKMDEQNNKPVIRSSQGIHLVFDKSFLPGTSALMIPKTSDGRVLFAVPWQNYVLVGTTDSPMENHLVEPVAKKEEIDFILKTITQYFKKTPEKTDVLSVYAGLRPLVAPKNENNKTKEISRSMKLIVSSSGLITVIGGKWTTYRLMGEKTVDKVAEIAGLPKLASNTKNLRIHGYRTDGEDNHLSLFGTDEHGIKCLMEENPELAKPIAKTLPYTKAEVVWAVRNEMAVTIEDVLARRTRILFLDARRAIEAAAEVALLMDSELKKDAEWKEKQVENFLSVASNYLLN